jgi:YidC/Oxa1 family membrane protein insertase
VVPNYGVAIIVLTVLVRLVMVPLTNRQMRSMERMRALAPKLKELQAKYADDRAKQSEEMMRLYRQEGVNPLGGCLPMVLQIPVFIGLFYALQSSISLRHLRSVGSRTSRSPELFTILGSTVRLPNLMSARWWCSKLTAQRTPHRRR